MGKYVRQNSNNVLIRVIIKLIIICFVVIPVFLFLYSFNIKQVEVLGVEHYKPEQIKDFVFQEKISSNSLYLYLKYKYLEQPRFPFVEKIDIKLVKPGIVTLHVYEKMVAGCVEMMGEYFYFDKDGIIVESSANKLEKVPLIKGLKFNEIILHEKLKVQKDEPYLTYEELKLSKPGNDNKDTKEDSANDEKKANKQDYSKINEDRILNGYIFDTIINLTQLIDKYEIDVDTVSFNSNHEITLECGSVTVYLGKKSTYDEDLSELKNIMKEVKGMDIIIDMKNKIKDGGGIIAKPK